jgi:hypothetical protein
MKRRRGRRRLWRISDNGTTFVTDAQIISMAITLFAIAAGSLFNNIRISDLATANNKRFDDVNAGFNRRMDDLRELMHLENARTQDKLDTVLKYLADLDTRVTR